MRKSPARVSRRGGEEKVRQASEHETDEAAKQGFIWHSHQYLCEFSRFADSKAGFSVAIGSGLLGALYNAKAHVLLQVPCRQWEAWMWLAAGASILLVISVGFAVWAVFPRLGSTQSKGFVYWGSIAEHGSPELLQASFHSQSARTLNDHLLHHVFDISKLLIPKYRRIAWSIRVLCIGAVMAVTSIIWHDLAQQKAHVPSPTIGVPVAPASSGPKK